MEALSRTNVFEDRQYGSDKGKYMEKKQKCSGREIAGFLLLGLSLIMLGRSVMLCFSNDIWYDELFTVGLAEHSYAELVRLTAADVHPPLYYCIVKLFSDLCKLIIPGAGTVIPAKIVSVMPYFILLLYAAVFIRKRFGMFVGGLFLFCVTAMPQLPAYTVEVRMYGWALLFVTAAFLHGWALVSTSVVRQDDAEKQNYVNQKTRGGKNRAGGYYVNSNTEQGKRLDGGKDGAGGNALADDAVGRRQRQARSLHGIAFVLCGLAAAYTQYFACVAVVMVYLCVLLAFWFIDRRRIKEWFLYVAVSVICYVPWLFALAGQLGAVSENYWILPLTWRSLGGCVKFLMKPAFADDRVNTVLAVVLFVSYLGLWCRELSKHYHKGRVLKENVDRFLFATAGIAVLAGLVAFGFTASFLIRPVFVYRYMIPAAGCFWLGFALCLDEMLCKQKLPEDGSGSSGTISRMAGIAIAVLFVIVGLRDYRAFMGEEEYKIRLMAETREALALIGPQDSVIYNFDQVQAVTGYYLPETTARYLWCAEGEWLIQEITSPCGTVEEADELRGILDAADEAGEERSLWFIGSFNSREDIVAKWREDGFEVEELGSFLLERYWFNLYKIS